MTARLCVRPVRFTADPQAHLTRWRALGAEVIGPDQGPWILLQFGSGRLALHTAADEFPAGRTDLGFETDDLDGWASAHGFEPTDQRFGRAVGVQRPDGLSFTIDPAQAPLPQQPGPGLTVDPLWFTAPVPPAGQVLADLGGQRELRSKDSGWEEYGFDLGKAQVHHGGPGQASLNFWHPGPLEDLQAQLAEVGVSADLIDESYGRSLRIPDPDLPEDEIWINEEQTDTYGYHTD